ncbi:MAG: hypothetical protein IKF90_10130 [Parasporobacterium sp.]|nr:hypothetical protein [Parasporobacterium sp.]
MPYIFANGNRETGEYFISGDANMTDCALLIFEIIYSKAKAENIPTEIMVKKIMNAVEYIEKTERKKEANKTKSA